MQRQTPHLRSLNAPYKLQRITSKQRKKDPKPQQGNPSGPNKAETGRNRGQRRLGQLPRPHREYLKTQQNPFTRAAAQLKKSPSPNKTPLVRRAVKSPKENRANPLRRAARKKDRQKPYNMLRRHPIGAMEDPGKQLINAVGRRDRYRTAER